MPRETVADTLSKPDIHREWIEKLRTGDVNDFGFSALERLLKWTDLKPAAKVLDAGCGTGTNARWLAQRGFKVTGADFSEFALEQAKAMSKDVDYRREDLTELSFPDSSFDAVACIGVLMHIPNLQEALLELVRVLRGGGWLLIAEANARAPETYLFRGYWRLRRRKIKVFRKPAGIEAWADTSAGPLLSRKMSAKWLTSFLDALGMKRMSRTTGELTELYAYTSNPRVQKLLHRINRLWFEFRGPPSAAIGNYFLFKKAG